MFLKNLTINKDLSELFQKQSLVDYLGQGRRIGLLDIVSEELENRNFTTQYIDEKFKRKVFDSIQSFIHSKNFKIISIENKTDINYWFDLYQIARNENRDDLASDCLIPVFESNLDIHEKMNSTANASALNFILGDDYVPRSETYIEKIIYQPNSEEKISYEYAFLACIYGIILIKKTDHIETALHFLEESRKILKLLNRKLQLEIHTSMLVTLGTQYFNANPPNFENAINIFNESIELYKDETKVSIGEAESYYRLAHVLITQPNKINTFDFNFIIDKAIDLYSQLNELDSLALSKTLKLVYFLNNSHKDNDYAINLATDLMVYYQEKQKLSRLNQIKFYLAHFYQRKNETEKAIQLAEEAKNYFWDSGPKSVLVEILELLDSLYHKSNNQRARNLFHLAKLHESEPNPNWDLAVSSLKQAIEIFELTNSIDELTGTHHRLARIYLEMPAPNLIDAEKEFLTVIDLHQNNDLKKARILFELVQYYEQTQNYLEAYRFSEMASAILSKSEEYSEEYASILYKQSQFLIKIKPIDFDKSIELSKKALTLFLEQKDRREIGVINHHLGTLYSNKPNPEYSISFEYYEKSLQILNSFEFNQTISQELFIVLLDYTFSLLFSKSNQWHIKAINNLESVINILEQFFDLAALERCCVVFGRIIENMNRSQCSQAISLGEKIYRQTQAISNLDQKTPFLITLIHIYQESQPENKERIKSLLFESLELILQEEEVKFSALFSIVGMLSSKEEILPNYSNVYPIMEKGINDLIESIKQEKDFEQVEKLDTWVVLLAHTYKVHHDFNKVVSLYQRISRFYKKIGKKQKEAIAINRYAVYLQEFSGKDPKQKSVNGLKARKVWEEAIQLARTTKSYYYLSMALTANARNWENIEPRNFSKAAQHYREAIEIIWRYPDEHKEKMDIIEVPHKIDRYIACKIVSYDQRNQHYKLFATHQELIKIIKPEVFDFIILLDFAGDPELGDQLKRNYPQNNEKEAFEDLYYCFRQNQFEKLQSLINSNFSDDPRKFLLWAIIKYVQESPESHNNLISNLILEHKQHWLKLFAVGYFRKYAPQKLQGYLEHYETLFQG